MSCGRISVQGEAEDMIYVSAKPAMPRPKKKRHHGKKSSSNPYSDLGLDKFASLIAELSAKREHVARETGNPEAMVRFVYTDNGWVPVGVKNGNDKGVSILPVLPLRTKPDNQSKENYSSNQKEDDDVKADEGCENGINGSAISQETMPWWSGDLKINAFGVLTLRAILVRKSAVPAAAMALVMVVGSLQRRWLGAATCMKRFIDTVNSYFCELFLYWKRSLEIKRSPIQGSLQVLQQPVASPEHKITNGKRTQGGPLFSLSAPCSPTLRGQAQTTVFSAPKNNCRGLEFDTQLKGKKKNDNKQFRRIVSMDGQPRKPIRLQQSDSFVRRRAEMGTIDSTVGVTVMIILLFLLVFYGRLCAICFTSAWWYLLSKFRTDSNNDPSSSTNNNSLVVLDLQSRE